MVVWLVDLVVDFDVFVLVLVIYYVEEILFGFSYCLLLLEVWVVVVGLFFDVLIVENLFIVFG